MASILVSIGTDGTSDWVRLPNGQKFNLGSVSVLSFATTLAKNTALAKTVIQDFLENGESLLTVNEDRMWAVLQQPRSMWASDSFMASDQQQETSKMSDVVETLDRMDQQIRHLNRLATVGEKDPKAFALLSRLASSLNPKALFASDDEDDAEEESEGQSKLAFDTYSVNMEAAKNILLLARETLATIDDKVAEGRKFNAARARADVRAITSKAGSICERTQLVEGWVTSDLRKLSSEMTRIHGLFHHEA
jgi:uncharacterized protein YukE